jgi:hypothetical protein
LEKLKELLGEELFLQVSEKLKGQDRMQLIDLQHGDFLKKEVVDAQFKTFEETQTALQKQVKSLAVEKALLMAGARNVRAVKGLLDWDLIEANEDGLSGLDAQVKVLQESDGYLFGAEAKVSTHAGNPAGAATMLDFENLSDEALFAARMNEIK